MSPLMLDWLKVALVLALAATPAIVVLGAVAINGGWR
jgi:hypothetical protein